jgi:hypothetical protein
MGALFTGTGYVAKPTVKKKDGHGFDSRAPALQLEKFGARYLTCEPISFHILKM